MKIKGMEGFIKHLPDYSEKKAKKIALRLPLFSIVFIILQILIINASKILYFFNTLQIWIILEPILPIINHIVFIFIGTLIAQIGFRAKKRLLEKDPRTAYQTVVKKVLGGISMVFSGLIASYIPIINPLSEITLFMSQSIIRNEIESIFFVIRLILGLFLLIIGIRTAYQSVQTFGIDTASLVYVYYPEEAKIVDNEIYSVVRHPMYLAVIIIASGSFVIYFSIYSTIMYSITLASFYRHIFLVEEKELIERFGESYKEYSKKVPALFVKPKNWGTFFKFLKN